MSATVLIVQPDSALAQSIGRLILEDNPEAQVGCLEGPQAGIEALAGFQELDLCVTEVYFEEGDGLSFLATLRDRFPRCRIIVVTRYDLENFAPYLQGLPVLVLPLDETAFRALADRGLDTLQGVEVPPLRIGEKQVPDRWGDCYAAYDTGVKRDVLVTALPLGATPDEALHFRSRAMAMARAVHPNVQTVYQAGQYQGRDFFSREKWDMPNLIDLAAAGQKIDGRLAARIIHAVGSLVLFWDANGFPHSRVSATDVSVSPQGVIKVANCVDPQLPANPPGLADLTEVAKGVRALLPPMNEVPQRVNTLLAKIGRAEAPLAETVGESQAIEIELAPKREIAETQEHHVALKAIQVQRKTQKRTTILMGVAILLALAGVAYVVYARFFAPPPSHAYNEMAAIPAGPYIYQDGNAVMDHPYYLDRYEVTFGQYLHFLEAVDRAGTDAAWRHPLQKGEKNHEPTDWADHTENGVKVGGIFSSIKFRQPYNKEYLTLDFPVFNIDWYDAQAYAKWAGKRLPNEHEWEKAGRGTNGFLYPWGNIFRTAANTGVPVPNAPEDESSSPHTHEAVDATPQDRSPYGVFDMAGNVSEWTDDIVPSPRMSSIKVAVIRGANFATKAIDHEQLTNRTVVFVPESRFFWLGFRCASDTPPPAK